MPCSVVVGGNFGDEGKGKVIAYLANNDKPTIIARGGVGPNAGHTVYLEGKKYGLRQLPCGFVYQNARLLIGPGVLINPDVVLNEIEMNARISHTSLAKKIGVSSLDAPVSGGDVGAKNGTLASMIGGDKESFEKILPLYEVMGKNIAYMGKAGAGQHTKMSNQILIAGTMIGVVESLLYAYKAGNDLQEVIDVIGSGAAGCWSINNLGPRIVKGNFDPGFFIKHFVKDMGIALHEADLMNLSLPGLALVYQFYKAAMAVGLEDLGTHGLYKVFAVMNGVEIK